MSLRYALLGLLTDESASGYDLARKFESSLDRYAWHAKHNQIYQELNRLAGDGLVALVEEGARGRKTYAITDAGHADLVGWLRRPPASPVVRNEWMLRIFLLSALGTDEARAALVGCADDMQREIDDLEALLAKDPDRHDPLAFGSIAGSLGLRLLPAIRDWATDEVARLDRAALEGRRD